MLVTCHILLFLPLPPNHPSSSRSSPPAGLLVLSSAVPLAAASQPTSPGAGLSTSTSPGSASAPPLPSPACPLTLSPQAISPSSTACARSTLSASCSTSLLQSYSVLL